MKTSKLSRKDKKKYKLIKRVEISTLHEYSDEYIHIYSYSHDVKNLVIEQYLPIGDFGEVDTKQLSLFRIYNDIGDFIFHMGAFGGFHVKDNELVFGDDFKALDRIFNKKVQDINCLGNEFGFSIHVYKGEAYLSNYERVVAYNNSYVSCKDARVEAYGNSHVNASFSEVVSEDNSKVELFRCYKPVIAGKSTIFDTDEYSMKYAEIHSKKYKDMDKDRIKSLFD